MESFLKGPQIELELKVLDSKASLMFLQYGDGDEFFREFSNLARVLTSNVGPTELDRVYERIDAILNSQGMDSTSD